MSLYLPAMAIGKQPGGILLALIGIEKLLRAMALLIIAVKAHQLLHRDVGQTLEQWVHAIRIDPANEHVHNLIHRLTGVSHRQLEAISLGSFLYSGLFLIEGLGLILHKLWAEFLTVITTALLLPMEVYEIFQGHHRHLGVKIIVFALNVAILIYLIVRVRKETGRRRA